jgi:hypothetical protein
LDSTIQTLFAAVQRTFEWRETPMPLDTPTGLTDQYATEWDARWKPFLNREHMKAASDDLAVLVEDLRKFLVPLTIPSNTATN